jgi:hypothetical protein
MRAFAPYDERATPVDVQCPDGFRHDLARAPTGTPHASWVIRSTVVRNPDDTESKIRPGSPPGLFVMRIITDCQDPI